jgi:carboxylate-amine ligase
MLTAFGDTEEVAALYDELLRRGCPAARQRAAFARRGDLRDVVDHLVGEGTGGTASRHTRKLE